MESFRALVEAMESDFQREETAPAARPKVENVDEDVERNSPASGASFAAQEAATEEGGRWKAAPDDLGRASWVRLEGEEGGRPARVRGEGRGKGGEAMKREQEPATWLRATQPGSAFEVLAFTPAARPWSQRGLRRGPGAPEGGRSAPEDHRGRRQAEGQAPLRARRPPCAAPPPGHPDAALSTPVLLGAQRTLASHSGFRRPRQRGSSDAPAGNPVGRVGGLPEDPITFRCHQCQASARDAGSLARHCRRHNPTRPFGCGLCSSRFNQLVHLQIHQRTHTGEKPFCCHACGARFSRKDRLRSHQRTHTGEKPYSCPHCDACFRDTASLKAHLRSHAGEKPYACRLCQASFVNLTTFTSHWRMHGAGDAQ